MPALRASWLLDFCLLATGLLYETVIAAADAHFHSQIAERGGLHSQGSVRCGSVGRIGHLDVVGFVTGHHLIARDAVSHGVHDGPLRSGDLPSSLGLFTRQIALP